MTEREYAIRDELYHGSEDGADWALYYVIALHRLELERASNARVAAYDRMLITGDLSFFRFQQKEDPIHDIR